MKRIFAILAAVFLLPVAASALPITFVPQFLLFDVSQVPAVPVTQSIVIDGWMFEVIVTAPAGATSGESLVPPLTVNLAVGPQGTINPASIVPEPGTAALLGLGLVGLAWMGRRRAGAVSAAALLAATTGCAVYGNTGVSASKAPHSDFTIAVDFDGDAEVDYQSDARLFPPRVEIGWKARTVADKKK